MIFSPQFPKKEFLLRVSYMEIYNETVTDLLVDSWKRKPLEVRETINVSGLDLHGFSPEGPRRRSYRLTSQLGVFDLMDSP